VAWRAWTRADDPVQVAGVGWWRRRVDAAEVGIALRVGKLVLGPLICSKVEIRGT
jgi:hypothetical protein